MNKSNLKKYHSAYSIYRCWGEIFSKNISTAQNMSGKSKILTCHQQYYTYFCVKSCIGRAYLLVLYETQLPTSRLFDITNNNVLYFYFKFHQSRIKHVRCNIQLWLFYHFYRVNAGRRDDRIGLWTYEYWIVFYIIVIIIIIVVCGGGNALINDCVSSAVHTHNTVEHTHL